MSALLATNDMHVTRRVLVLRPLPAANLLADALLAAGHLPVVAPAIQIVPIAPGLASSSDSRDADVVVFVSPAAVRFGLSRVKARSGAPWLAVGAATAAALGHAGHQAITPQDQRSEGLLRLAALQSGDGDQVQILCGSRSRPLLRESLLQRGFRVLETPVYERVPMPIESIIKALDTRPEVVLVTSIEILDTFDLALGSLAAEPAAAIRALPLLVPSQRVAEKAKVNGYTSIKIAGGADHALLVTAVNSL